MNFKPELLAKVLAGEKTQTRRPSKPGETAMDVYGGVFKVDHPLFKQEVSEAVAVYDAKGRTRYEVGKVYAVCPGRGKSAPMIAHLRTAEGVITKIVTENDGDFMWAMAKPARIKIIQIRCEDVRNISIEDARAEGFEYPGEFLKVWCGFYDKKASWEFDPQRVDYWINTGKRRELVGWDTVLEIIHARPAHLYQGWALTFKLQ